MVNGIINVFMKVSGQNDLEHSSYDLSKFFLKNLKIYLLLNQIIFGDKEGSKS